MIDFIKYDDQLIFHYSPEGYASIDFIWKSYTGKKEAIIRKVFTFTENDLIDPDHDEYENDNENIFFIFGKLEGDFYKINKDCLSINNNLYINKDIKIDTKLFVATRDISIFKKIDHLLKEDIFLGITEDCNLNLYVYKDLIQKFPNTYELSKYSNSRISSVLTDYFSTMENSYEKYQKYLNKKYTAKKPSSLSDIKDYDRSKYIYILELLKTMIRDEINYTEKQWQDCILEIILLIYPKYIVAIDELHFNDVYNDTKRKLDFALIDTDGNIDIAEIKKADIGNIISKRKYRDNYIPLKELSGTIMQVEKYIYYLHSVGKKELIKIKNKYNNVLPKNIELKITNPQGIIIMGKSSNLTTIQKNDFEIIKRKYKNIVDILTYEDLINRLEMIINKVYESNNDENEV